MGWGFFKKISDGIKKAAGAVANVAGKVVDGAKKGAEWIAENGANIVNTATKVGSDLVNAMPNSRARDILNAGTNLLNTAGNMVNDMATNITTGNLNGLRDTMRNNPLKDSFNSLRSTVRRK